MSGRERAKCDVLLHRPLRASSETLPFGVVLPLLPFDHQLLRRRCRQVVVKLLPPQPARVAFRVTHWGSPPCRGVPHRLHCCKLGSYGLRGLATSRLSIVALPAKRRSFGTTWLYSSPDLHLGNVQPAFPFVLSNPFDGTQEF